YELTKELLAEEGLSVDDQGFEELMEEQRRRARAGVHQAGDEEHGSVLGFVDAAPATDFVGYERLDTETAVAAVGQAPDGVLVKLEESPFYPEGGGQVSDSGSIAWDGGEAGVEDVYRVGEDQALLLRPDAPSGLEPGVHVAATVDHLARNAIMRNHTA